MSGNVTTCATWRLRNATADDEPFLRSLFAQTHTALATLPPAVRDALAAMQYRARALSYSSAYRAAIDSLICRDDGEPIGRLLVARVPGQVRIVDIALLPRWQRQGLGTAVLQSLCAQALGAGSDVLLAVQRASPAVRLYRRLGFESIVENDLDLEMRLRSTP